MVKFALYKVFYDAQGNAESTITSMGPDFAISSTGPGMGNHGELYKADCYAGKREFVLRAL